MRAAFFVLFHFACIAVLHGLNNDIPSAFMGDGEDVDKCEGGACRFDTQFFSVPTESKSASGLAYEKTANVKVKTDALWSSCAPDVKFKQTAAYFTDCSFDEECNYENKEFIANGEINKDFLISTFSGLSGAAELIEECVAWDGSFGDYYVDPSVIMEIESSDDGGESSSNNDTSTYVDNYDEDDFFDDEDLIRRKRDIEQLDEKMSIVELLGLKPEAMPGSIRVRRDQGDKAKKGKGKDVKKGKGKGKRKGKGKGKGKRKGKGKGKGKRKGKGKGKRKGKGKGKGVKKGKGKGKGKRKGKGKGKGKRKGKGKGKGKGTRKGKGKMGRSNKNASQETLNKAFCVDMAIQRSLEKCVEDKVNSNDPQFIKI